MRLSLCVTIKVKYALCRQLDLQYLLKAALYMKTGLASPAQK